MYRAILFLILSFFVLPSFSSSVSTNGTGGGDWDDSATWDPSGVPGCVDTIIILAGDVVDIDSHQDYEHCGSMVVLIYGTINFPDNGPKWRLPCGSYIQGFEGSAITAPGHDNSNKISICEAWVWESSDPDLMDSFELGVAPAPLPVILSNYIAEIDNTSVKLLWTTAAELNNDYFTIERSTNGLDFEELGEVPGNGNSTNQIDYEYFDDAPLMGTSYYRLKQTDFDGQYEYSGLISVNYNMNEDGICTLKVYPNPCVGACTIDLKDCPLTDNQVEVELYDTMGKKIVNKITPKSKDQDISFHLNANNNLSPGVYIVKSSANGKNQSSKVIVK